MMTCPQDLQVRYTESIAEYIWLEKVCSCCFYLPLDKSLDSVFLDESWWIIIHFFLQAAMLIAPKHCSCPLNASFGFLPL